MKAGRALVLFAHGSRNPDWAAPLHALAACVRQQSPDTVVQTAFLEHLPPTLPQTLCALAPQHPLVDVLPVFWAPAGHVERDLPSLIASAQASHPGLQVRVLPVLSQLPGLLNHVAQSALRL